MEDLIRSLSSLGLHPPTPSQLTDLLEPNKEDQKRLAQLLSLSTISSSNSDSDAEDDLTTSLMTQDLIVEGIQSLLQSFNQSIEKEKTFYQKELQSLHKPNPLKLVPIKALLARQESDIRRTQNDRENVRMKGAGKGYQPKLILDVGISNCSIQSLFDLERMDLNKSETLKVPKRYKGKYLLAKVISKLNHYVGVSFIISDPDSNSIPISVSHFLPQNQLNSLNDGDEVSNLLPIGTMIAIKEPFISLNHYTRAGPTCSKQVIGIRIDSPDDLVVLSGESFYDDLGWKDVQFKGEAKEIGVENEGRNGIDEMEGRWRQEGYFTRLAIEKRQKGDRDFEIESGKTILKRCRRFLEEKRIGSAHREFLAARKFGVLPSLPSNLSSRNFDSSSILEKIYVSKAEKQPISILLETLSLQVSILESLESWDEMIEVCRISLNLISSIEQNENQSPTCSSLNIPSFKSRFENDLSKSQLLSQTCKTGPTSSQVQSFYSLSQTSLSPNMESSHYVSSKVEVRDLSHIGKGRGLVLVEDVEPGELLLCCKALGAAYPLEDQDQDQDDSKEENLESEDKIPDGKLRNGVVVENGKDHQVTNGQKKKKKKRKVLETILRLNFEKNSMSRTSQVKAATNVVHALMDQPALCLPFLGLTAGPIPDSPYVSQPYPLRWKSSPSDLDSNLDLLEDRMRGKGTFIDSAYVEGVLSFNAFGPGIGPGRSEGLEKKSKIKTEIASQAKSRAQVDATHQQIQSKDSSSPNVRPSSPSSSASKKSPIELTGEFARSTMPHPLPAIMNHSCLPNVSSVFLGDTVTTRSLHYLEKGTEIVHQYVRGEETFQVRQSMTKKHGFDCSCPLCLLDNKDGEIKRKKREEILIRELPTVVERSRIVLKPKFKGEVKVKLDEDEDSKSKEIGKRNGHQVGTGLDEKEIEAHKEIQEHLISLIGKIQETYHEERGSLKPDLFEIWHRVALHSETIGEKDQAIEYELNALRSASAIPISDELPSSLEQDLPMRSEQEVVGGMKASNMMLSRLPDLHFDNALQSMLSIADLLLPESPLESSKWVSTAFWLHECVIAGGTSVFLDRWADGVDLDLSKWSDLDSVGNGGLRGNGDGSGLLSGRWKDALENWLKLKG